MTLKELGIGQSAMICKVGGEGALRQHFLDMGMIPGTEIKNEKNKKVLESTDDLVYSCVGLYPKNVDQIAQESRVEIRKLMSILVTLELQGYIREITKNYYIRIK